MPLRRFTNAKGSPHPNTQWEAFSFELIPFNAYYTMLQADFFNGDRREPAPPLPTYSWDDEKSVSFDPGTGLRTSVRKADKKRARTCHRLLLTVLRTKANRWSCKSVPPIALL
jgi:hypothetical protein